MLHKKINGQSVRNVPWYQAEAHLAVPEPVLGPDIFDPRRAVEIKALLADTAALEARYIRLASRAEMKHGKGEGEGEAKKPAAAKPAPKPAAPAKSPAETKLEENKADANFAQQAEQHHTQTAAPKRDGDKNT